MIGDLIKINVDELPSRRARKKPFFRRTGFKFLLLGAIILGLSGYIGGQIYLKPFREKAASYDLTQLNKLEESSIVYDRNNLEIGRLASENRQLVTYDEIPPHFIEALVATEDSRFWTHRGIDWYGVTRATVWNTIQGQSRQGASTITQQLARQTFRLFERSLDRKITEAFLAERIEKVHNSKPRILEMYLNRIYFGSGFYGIGAAAQGYFSRTVPELTLEESAILVGLIKNPRLYSPISGQRELTLRERNEVYDRMVLTDKLTKQQAAELKVKPLVINLSETARASGYLQQEVENEVDRILEQQGYEGIGGKGFKVYTTVDSVIQQAAEASMKARLSAIEALPEYPKPPGRETPAEFAKNMAALRATGNPRTKAPTPAYLQGAALVIDNKTGAILSMVGGREFKESQYNRVVLTKRPAGTVFTPFVYAAAFEGRSFPGSRVQDDPMDNTRVMVGATTGMLGEWGMETLQGVHEGEISVRQAIAEGKNNCVARLGLETGTDKVIDFAKRAGLDGQSNEPATLLGRGEVSVRDLCLAYSTFPNGGVRPTATSIVTRIENASGQIVYSRPANSYPQVRVTDPITAWMVHSCLDDALAVGTGKPATDDYGLKNFPAAGKTGTHSKSTDLWFAGYSSDLTCVVWTGLDRKDTIYPDAFSNRVALPVWTDIMNASQANFKGRDFQAPEDIGQVELCTVSGKLATDACLELRPDPADPTRNKLFKSSYLEYVRPGYRLTQPCDFHSNATSIEAPDVSLDPPSLFSPAGVGMAVELEEATAVPLKAPTVIGKDPYESRFGVEIAAVDPSRPPRASVVKDEVPAPAPPPMPVYQPGKDLLTPNPGRASVDD